MKYTKMLRVVTVRSEFNTNKQIITQIQDGLDIIGEIQLTAKDAYHLGCKLQYLSSYFINFGEDE